MKKNKTHVIALLLFLGACHANAQDGWFCAFQGTTTNYWSQLVMTPINEGINSLIGYAFGLDDDEYYLPQNYGYEYFSIRDDGRRIYVGPNGASEFSMRSILSNIKTGFRIGWQGAYSPVGIYADINYRFRQFYPHMEVTGDNLRCHLHSFEPGLGIRISPLVFMLDEYDWCPIFEIGANYVNNFSFTGGYGKGVDEVNSGFRYNYAVGVNFKNFDDVPFNISLGFEHYDFNIFNQEFSPDGGLSFPYANAKTKLYRIYLSITQNF